MKALTPLLRTFLVVLAACLAAAAGPRAGSAQAPGLHAGVAVADITPPAGYAQYRGSATGVHDPLQAKALVLRQGEERAALVVCDLISITGELSGAVRTRVAEETGIPFENIIVAGTHTHTGPSYHDELETYVLNGGSGGSADDAHYPARLIYRIAQAVIEADAAARPVRLQAGAGEAHGLSFNRRFLMKDGRVRFNPGVRNPDIVRPMGPIDPEVGILMLRDAASGAPRAGLTVFALHLDTVGGTDFSADYPGYLATALRETFGEGFVSLFGAGTCGNINHIDVSGARSGKGHEGITRPTGEALARVVEAEAARLADVSTPSLAVRSEMVFAPLQAYTPEELAWAKSGSEEPLYPERTFLQQRRRAKILSLEKMRTSGRAIPPTIGEGPWTLPLEVQVIRLGADAAIVGLPGEVFVELGLAIKEASPFAHTYVVELTNSSIAYVPTREAFGEGDYEVINSRVAAGGGEMMVEAAVRLLRALKADLYAAGR